MTSSVNPLDIILQRIYSTIPRELLDLGFNQHNESEGSTLDDKILDRVVRRRVIQDVSIAQGRPKPIILREEYRLRADDIREFYLGPSIQGDLYQVPPDVRDHRNISAIRNVSFGIGYARSYGASPMLYANQGNTMNNLAGAITESHTRSSAILTPVATLWDGNVIQITPTTTVDQLVIECVLAYDDNLTNLPASMVDPIAELCVIAAKQMLFTDLVIKIDIGQVFAGANIGRIRDMVDRYEQEGSPQMYAEAMGKVKEGHYFDPESARALMKYFI
jgi:hypothetical protein